MHFSYNRLIVLQRKVGIESKVVADTILTAFLLQHSVEIGNLVSAAKRKRFLRRLDKLSGTGVERQRAAVAVFNVERKVVLKRSRQTKQRSEFLRDSHRRDIIWRRRHRTLRLLIAGKSKIAIAGANPVQIR